MSEETKEENYLDELDELENDDFDVEIKKYDSPPAFKEFIIKPFECMEKKQSIICSTGQIRLPKEIIEKYVTIKGWSFENYSHLELLALLYLFHYKDADEWKGKKGTKLLNEQLNDILKALPHFATIGELIMYAIAKGDLTQFDLDQVIESDASGSYDVTNLNDD